MAKRILNSTPKKDGYRMPGEYEPQEQIWMFLAGERRRLAERRAACPESLCEGGGGHIPV